MRCRRQAVNCVCAAAALILLCSCSGSLDTTYRSQTQHEIKSETQANADQPDAETYIDSCNFAQLTENVMNLVRARAEYGIIRIGSYDGEIDTDAETACVSVAYGTPYGNYAVHYFNCTVTKFVPYTELKVYFSYRDGSLQYKDIPKAESDTQAEELLRETLGIYGQSLTVYMPQTTADDAYIQNLVEELYFSGELKLPVMPAVTVNIYTGEGENPETGKIVDISFDYTFSQYRLENMSRKVSAGLEEIVPECTGENDMETVQALYDYLTENVSYAGYGTETDEYDRHSEKYTAYGALALKTASGEGYAMAMKLLCNELNIECVVVRGRHNNVAHAWNIVCIEGKYYHVDAALAARNEDDGTCFCTDNELDGEYFWDKEKYPETQNGTAWGSTDINSSAGAGAEANPEETEESGSEIPDETEAAQDDENISPSQQGEPSSQDDPPEEQQGEDGNEDSSSDQSEEGETTDTGDNAETGDKAESGDA